MGDWIQEVQRPKTLAIFFSSGDLGDVGRHAVVAALELPPTVVGKVLVLARNAREALLVSRWECGCPGGQHGNMEKDRRLQIIEIDVTREAITPFLEDVDAIITCLGNRQPFHDDVVAYTGTDHVVQSMLAMQVHRICMLSSVGLGDDWPPLHWHHYGRILQGMFRTVCWRQFQDLSGAELAIRQNDHLLDFLVARAVVVEEDDVAPTGRWMLQFQKDDPPPDAYLAHLDCARFLVQEAVLPRLSRQAVVVGGVPTEEGAQDSGTS